MKTIRIKDGRLYNAMTPIVPNAVKRMFTVKVLDEVVKVCGDPEDWVSWEFINVKVQTGFKIVDHLEKNPNDYHIIRYHKEAS